VIQRDHLRKWFFRSLFFSDNRSSPAIPIVRQHPTCPTAFADEMGAEPDTLAAPFDIQELQELCFPDHQQKD